MANGINISITKKAFIHLLKQKKEKKGGVRIYREWSGCCGSRYVASLEEAPREDEVVYGINGIKIYISKYLAEFIGEVEIDYDDEMGGGLMVRAPAPRCEGGAC
jgi:Fe-S cluster assembly iron-binding protein IscA